MRGYILAICFILGYLSSQGQALPDYVHAKTPEVTAFNRNIEMPVSQYTGVPNISIPIFNIKLKEVEIPITLRYHAGGIRVDQEATWVGLGWSLDYGGTISRIVKGAPDEDFFLTPNQNKDYSIAQFSKLPYTNQSEIFNRMDYLRNAKYGGADFMPDEFYYSSPNYSGRFMFSQNLKKFLLYPKEDIAVSYQPAGTVKIGTWNLKLPNGISVDYGGDDAFTGQTDNKLIRNSWQIKRIRNTFNENVDFNYEQFTYSTNPFQGSMAQFFYRGLNGHIFPTSSFGVIGNTDTRIKTISFPGGIVTFTTIARRDMPTRALSEIVVKNTNGTIIKKVVFHYGYFNGSAYDMLPSENPGLAASSPSDYRYLRLRLDSVTIESASKPHQRYKFTYYQDQNLPSKYSFSQDHWGFYNGAANMTAASFIPNIASGLFTGGDRSVRPSKSMAFTLKDIVYPEGGTVRLQYENNTAQVTGLPAELLSTYQDDNIPEVTQAIGLSSYSRLNFQTKPDSTSGETMFFIKRFSVSPSGSFAINHIGFDVSTDYGISTSEQYTPYNADNVEFYVNRVNPDGTKTLLKSFNTTNPIPNSNGTYTRTGNYQAGLNLVGGNYEMVVRIQYLNGQGSIAENQRYSLYFGVRYRELDTSKMMIYTGGLRIKKISYFDNNNKLQKATTYKYVNPNDDKIPTLTSGRVFSLPRYFQHHYQMYEKPLVYSHVLDFNTSVKFTSNSILPLESTSGSYAGYEYVDEIAEDSVGNEPLKTSYRFSFNQPYYFNSSYPSMEMKAYEPQEWTNGKLLEKSEFKGSKVIKREEYQYYFLSPHLPNGVLEDYAEEINTNLVSLQYLASANSATQQGDFVDRGPSLQTLYDSPDFGRNSNCIAFNYGAYDGFAAPQIVGVGVTYKVICEGYIKLPLFKRYTGIDRAKSKTVTTYDGLQAVKSTENYFYEKTPFLYQLSKKQTINSVGDTLEQRIQYPSDSTSVDVYNRMVKRHIVNPVIVSTNYKNGRFLQSNNTNYGLWQDTAIIAPLRTTLKSTSGALKTQLTYLAYDDAGNILSAAKPLGAKVSVKWGYNKAYPIAESKNASDKEFFYDGYEESTASGVQTNSLTSHTGIKYTTTPSVSWIRPNSRSYVISYWYRVGTEWKYSGELPYAANTYTMTGGNAYDDVRIYPKDAQMTTFTYVPLVGMTSQTDAKGQTSYYEYDDYQRLYRVRDQDRHIVKQYCYNYAGQQTDCSVPAIPDAGQPSVIYARLEKSNETSWSDTRDPNNRQEQTSADFNVVFYSDAACKTKVTLSAPLDIKVNVFQRESTGYGGDYDYSNDYTYHVPAGADHYNVGTNAVTYYSRTYPDPQYGSWILTDTGTFQYALLVNGDSYIVSPAI